MAWKFWSPPESIASETPSVMAIAETVLAIGAYWYYAIHFNNYLPLIIGAAIAPLVLLRSDKSVALGVRWFLAFEHFCLYESDDNIYVQAAVFVLPSVIIPFCIYHWINDPTTWTAQLALPLVLFMAFPWTGNQKLGRLFGNAVPPAAILWLLVTMWRAPNLLAALLFVPTVIAGFGSTFF
jgi:hypothetical protein